MIAALNVKLYPLWSLLQRIAAIFVAVLVLAPGLAGCSMLPYGPQVKAIADQAEQAGIADRMAYNDQKAKLLLAAPCDVSIGAYYRLANYTQQKALGMLCSGVEPGAPDPLAAADTGSAPAAGGPENGLSVDPALTNSP